MIAGLVLVSSKPNTGVCWLISRNAIEVAAIAAPVKASSGTRDRAGAAGQPLDRQQQRQAERDAADEVQHEQRADRGERRVAGVVVLLQVQRAHRDQRERADRA